MEIMEEENNKALTIYTNKIIITIIYRLIINIQTYLKVKMEWTESSPIDKYQNHRIVAW